MLVHLRPAAVLLAIFTILTGIIYPMVMTGFAQATLFHRANGSPIEVGGKTIGSALIGQAFSSDRYFHGRPSATSAPDPKDVSNTVDSPYKAANSSGSNLGPLSKKLIDRVVGDVEALKKAGASVIPADAVTTSASGLDPHISPAYARLQVGRVAAARGMPAARVQSIVDLLVEKPLFGFIGEPRVNVLALNIALDAAGPREGG